jgi:hypothetical protein
MVDEMSVDLDDEREDESTVERIAEMYGPPPTEEEMRRVYASGAAIRERALSKIAERSYGSREAADLLGISPSALAGRRTRGTVLAVKRGNRWLFPKWQFVDGQTMPRLPELIRRWPGSTIELCGWATRPAADLHGRKPQHVLRRDPEKVLRLVDAIRAAVW